MLRPAKWIYATEGFSVDLPADLPNEGSVQPVRYGSTLRVLKQAIGIYWREFRTIAGILLIPVLAGELAAHVAHEVGWELAEAIAWWLETVIAFAPLVVATSDVCIGNRPSVRRSYRRAGVIAVLRVIAGSALATVLVLSPFVIGIPVATLLFTGMTAAIDNSGAAMAGGCLAGIAALVVILAMVIIAVRFFVWVLYVPLIAVVEPGVSLRRIIERSRRLGEGYFNRTLVVAILTSLIAALGWVVHETAKSGDVEILGILFARLLGPVPYIAATLIYYDLRSRKEGYGVAERPEDLE